MLNTLVYWPCMSTVLGWLFSGMLAICITLRRLATLVCWSPFEVIKVLGDWKSDSVFDYLKPSVDQKLAMCNKEFANM